MVAREDIRGVFHNHTTASDGRATLEEMAAAAGALGFEYLGLADHSKASFQARGLDDERVLEQVERIRAFNESGESAVHLFAGIECDILRQLDEDSTWMRWIMRHVGALQLRSIRRSDRAGDSGD